MVDHRRKLNQISVALPQTEPNPNHHGEDTYNFDGCSPSTTFSDVVVDNNNSSSSSDKEDDGPVWWTRTWVWAWAWTGEKSVGWGFGDERCGWQRRQRQ
jgi:hypothetical protein